MRETAVIEYYEHSGLNWSSEMVRSQILSVYNSKEVSSFSQLDIKSIMHYPMPKEVTGLADDIPYSEFPHAVCRSNPNFFFADSELSPLDKAYMTINYPFPAGAPAPTHWSLSIALDVAGVPAELANEIVNLAKDPRFDVSEIRTKFAHWSQEAHHTMHKEMALSPATVHPTHDLPRTQRRHKGKKILSQSITTPSDCATTSPVTQSVIAGAQHAVSVRHLLWELPEVVDDMPDYHPKIELKYQVIDTVRPPTQYQMDRLVRAMAAWEKCCCVRFVAAKEEDGTPPLRILINLGEPDDLKKRSSAYIGTTIDEVSPSKPTVTLYLFENEEESIAWDEKPKEDAWPLGRDLNLRTCLHEVCHLPYFVHQRCS